MTAKLTNKQKEYAKKLPDCSDILRVYEAFDYVEFVIDRWGDICTYRVYRNGEVCEKINTKWKPKDGDQYYFISGYGYIDKCTYYNDFADLGYLTLNNYFRTKKEAEFRLEQIQVYNELKSFAEDYNYEIDWNKKDDKFYICVDTITKTIFISSTLSFKDINQIYFSCEELTKQAIEKVGEDRIKKYLFEVEDE